jgi:hypothetical protein
MRSKLRVSVSKDRRAALRYSRVLLQLEVCSEIGEFMLRERRVADHHVL